MSSTESRKAVLVKPTNPGKYIHDLFTNGFRYAVEHNGTEMAEAEVTCGGDCGEIPQPSNEKYEPDPQVKKHLSMRSGGLIAEVLKGDRYNWWKRK